MIVSPSRKFVFVHIPKNAGSTVEALLKPHLDPDRDLHVSEAATLADNRAAVGIGPEVKLLKHITAHRLHRSLPAGVYDDLFSFAFSRNPFSRCYSAYKFIARRAAGDLRRQAEKGTEPDRDRSKFMALSFDEVCLRLPEIALEHRLFRSQTFWLRDVNSVNFVGRLENLADDMRVIYGQIGLPAAQLDDIPVENMSASKGAWREMAGASVDAIRAFYAVDFERYGYSTGFDGDDGAPARDIIGRIAPARGPRKNRARAPKSAPKPDARGPKVDPA